MSSKKYRYPSDGTEWKEFETLDCNGKIVIDGKSVENAVSKAKIREETCW